MYKAIVIEDEQGAANLLVQMLHEIEPDIVVVEKCGDLPSGVKSIKKHNPYIVFLDIELPIHSGMQLLEFFNPEDIDFKIIFTTAYNQYAVRAFEMCAIDYLMKPIQEDLLRAAVAKAIRTAATGNAGVLSTLKQNFQSDKDKKIVLPISNGYEIINVQNICYLRAEGSYTQIFTINNETILASKNLKHFQFILEEISFFYRIHRSTIVNIRFIKKLLRSEGGILLLEDKTQLPIANDKIDGLLLALNNM